MKRVSFFFILLLSLISCNTKPYKDQKNVLRNDKQATDTSEMTNNFYDNSETYSLPVNGLTIVGEITNPGNVDFSDLPLHSVIVKETLPDSAGGGKFVGAYRYDGYSLFDILNDRIIKKTNSAEFKPIIDLYVEIENKEGEKVVFSWGEIYYPNNLHRILIATGVSRIVPSSTGELWPLTGKSKIVAGNDLVTARNITDPIKITVKSIRKSFTVAKGMSPMYSAGFKLFDMDKQLDVISQVKQEEPITFNTIFYGRGKGIHSTTPFTGLLLKDVIGKYYPVNHEYLKAGIFCLVGKDGYRCAVSFSELFNRNDQQEFLIIKTKTDEDGGLFRIFAAADFFSDRAIKSVNEIYLGI
jgi:hypothetical protein